MSILKDTKYHILNLGAGIQSTSLYLLDLDGELNEEMGIKFTHAIFADTQDEPSGVYEHLDWLESQGGVPIIKGTAGSLGDDLLRGENSTSQRFATIPAFTMNGESKGMTRRQCTSEYKVNVVERIIRREILALKPRQHIPKPVDFTQYLGFSFDEPGRAARAKGRFDQRGWRVGFPLFDMQWARTDCIRYLEGRVPHPVPRSACVFCPFKSNREWRDLKSNDPDGWARAVEVDEGLRKPGVVVNRGMYGELFLHRACVPIRDANLESDQTEFGFMGECEGGCGL